jgi:hypothetical protein
MTEQEWLACTRPETMLTWLAQGWRRRFARWFGLPASLESRQKLWLFAGACCVRSTQGVTVPHWDDELRNLVALGKGEIDVQQFESLLGRERGALVQIESFVLSRAESAARHKAIHRIRDVVTQKVREGAPARWNWEELPSLWEDERTIQSRYLRDIFGNPFRPAAAVNPEWLTWNDRTVSRIVQSMNDERDFERMPILGDALEDAGCGDADILRHCREPGEHVRGCWVLDLLLGKE